MSKPSALVIDDEPDILELLSLTLSRMEIETSVAADVASARRLLENRHFDLCLTDMRLPDGDGLDLVDWMQTHTPGVPVAVITAHGNVETAVQALKAGAFDFVSKPLDLTNLRNIVQSALKLKAQEAEAGDDNRLLGRSAPMRELKELVERVARSQAPVHICGESGTGKELVARLIHDTGPRADGPFVPVNCGAIPAELMESEFFGHRKGAFTGAVSDKAGLLQAASGGTLFLDEIADLPLPMQVKLLRVIQEQKVRPVGAEREEKVDVRILSATHRNLSEMVANSEFREDLFYRINVIELRVPALRERREDIPVLVERFLEEEGLPVFLLSGGSLDLAINSYDWPGNVRELRNAVIRIAALRQAGLDESASFEEAPEADDDSAAPAGLKEKPFQEARRLMIDAFERDYLAHHLHLAEGNMSAAARSAEMDRSYFRRLALRHGLDEAMT